MIINIITNINIWIIRILNITSNYSACGLSGRSWPCVGLRRVRWNAPNALECAECAGMRRLRWNALESTDCAELRQLAPFAPTCAPFAPIAPTCADCVVCAELRRLRCLRRIAPIALELRWNSAYSLAQSECYPVAVAAWCSLLAAVREINNAGQTLNDCYCLPFSCFFWRKTTNLASIDVHLCAHPEFCAHFGTVLGLLNI